MDNIIPSTSAGKMLKSMILDGSSDDTAVKITVGFLRALLKDFEDLEYDVAASSDQLCTMMDTLRRGFPKQTLVLRRENCKLGIRIEQLKDEIQQLRTEYGQ